MIAISTKDLRQKFPFVRSELKKGTTFMIIHKSRPIAKLQPIEENTELPEIDEEDRMWEQAAAEDVWNSLGEPSKEEIAYYKKLLKESNQ